MSNLELLFKILAAVFLGVAAFFLWQNNTDGIFISAVIGAVCFFLSVRFQIVEKNKQRAAEQLAEGEFEEADAETFDQEANEPEEISLKEKANPKSEI
jgi:hypothetical protein